MEINFGEGGDDSKQFVKELGSIYVKYAEYNRFKVELLNTDEGIFIAQIIGKNAYEKFRTETGKHVVQRCHKKAKKHTSIVSVSIIKLRKTQPTQQDLSDIEFKTQTRSGPGGQHQNRSNTAVRAKHLPTGISVLITGRSQADNKQKATSILMSKIDALNNEREACVKTNKKRQQISSGGYGNRSGVKVRTYNVSDGLIVDHVSGIKTTRVKEIFKGDLDQVRK